MILLTLSFDENEVFLLGFSIGEAIRRARIEDPPQPHILAGLLNLRERISRELRAQEKGDDHAVS